jgi:hypothetical protein
MAKEVKLKASVKGEDVKIDVVKEEVKEEAKEVKIGTPQDAEEVKKVLSEEEINIENSKKLRKTLRGIQHNDLIGYIILFNDHKTKRVGVMSSIDQSVAQFVALAHGGYIDKYDQIINQCITTRTIDRMNPVQELPEEPKQLENGKEKPESESKE